MWARTIEVMLAVWLAMSPWIFRESASRSQLTVDLAAAFLIAILALMSFWRPLRRSHLGIIAVAFFLVGFGFLSPLHPTPAALQNDIVVGFLLMMIAIIPTDANESPESWRRLAEEHQKDGRTAVAVL